MTPLLVWCALAAQAASPDDVTGTLTGDPGLLRGGDRVFLSARPEGVTSGPPTWVKRIDVERLPMPFQLGPDDAMLGGPTPARVVLTARLDRDGDAKSKGPDDAVATSTPVAPGTSGLTLALLPVEGEATPATSPDSLDGGAPPPRNAPPAGVVAGAAGTAPSPERAPGTAASDLVVTSLPALDGTPCADPRLPALVGGWAVG